MNSPVDIRSALSSKLVRRLSYPAGRIIQRRPHGLILADGLGKSSEALQRGSCTTARAHAILPAIPCPIRPRQLPQASVTLPVILSKISDLGPKIAKICRIGPKSGQICPKSGPGGPSGPALPAVSGGPRRPPKSPKIPLFSLLTRVPGPDPAPPGPAQALD